MATMKWTKPTADTIAYFERIAPGPPMETRSMFGMPCRFLNGHMLVGVFQDTLMLHLKPEDRVACIEAGAKPFAPMGREAKEYVDVAPGTFDDREMKEWIVRGMRYLGGLPPKLNASAKTMKSPTVPARAAKPVTAAKAKPVKPAKAKRKPAKRVAKVVKKAAKAVAKAAKKPAQAAKRAKAAKGKRRR